MTMIRVSAKINPPKAVMASLGVDERGRVQEFLTARVLLHMRRFMPWLSGEMASAQTQQLSPTTIGVMAPQARYLYFGKKMRDPDGGGPFPILDPNGEFQGEFRYRRGAHPVPTEEDLEYTHDTNPDAGPYWDVTMVNQEGDQIAREVTEYIRRMT
jgi:hypothetical protein